MAMSLSVAVERDLSKGQLVFLLVHRETAPQRATGLLSQDRQPPWQISALAQPHQEPKSLLTIPTGQVASLDLILMPHVSGISVPMGSQVCLLQPSLNPPDDQVSALVSVLDPVPCLSSVSHPPRGRGQTFLLSSQSWLWSCPQGCQHHREVRPQVSPPLMLLLPCPHTSLGS